MSVDTRVLYHHYLGRNYDIKATMRVRLGEKGRGFI